jgi:copper chaperone CopZ
MTNVTFQVPNISCGHCVSTIETELSDLEGVISVKADAASKTAVISFQDPATEQLIKDFLKEINYPVSEN